MNKTKTYNYLFEPTITLFHAPAVKDLLLNEKVGFKIINVYISDSSLEDSKPEDGIFYILVDRNHGKFAENIEKLKAKSSFYIDNYLIGSFDSKYAIIRFNSFRGKILNAFLNSRYSQMYEQDTLSKFKSRFQRINKDKKLEINHNFKVLTAATSLKKQLIDSLKTQNTNNNAELDELYLNDLIIELDSKLNFQKETINSDTYDTNSEN